MERVQCYIAHLIQLHPPLCLYLYFPDFVKIDPKYFDVGVLSVSIQSCIFLFCVPLTTLRFKFLEYSPLNPRSDTFLLIFIFAMYSIFSLSCAKKNWSPLKKIIRSLVSYWQTHISTYFTPGVKHDVYISPK